MNSLPGECQAAIYIMLIKYEIASVASLPPKKLPRPWRAGIEGRGISSEVFTLPPTPPVKGGEITVSSIYNTVHSCG